MGTETCYDKYFYAVLKVLPESIRSLMNEMPPSVWKEVNEIRFRAGAFIMVCVQGTYRYLDDFLKHKNTLKINQRDLKNILELATGNSVYMHQEDIKKGFVTLREGIRIGICGRVIMKNNEIANIYEISSLNIRISREYKGCAMPLMKYIVDSSGNIANTLIISPPMCGKTTVLRDICRLLSDGYSQGPLLDGVNVGLIDERSEIASCKSGVPQRDVGKKTDIYDDCPKVLGMNMIIRCMSPAVIITDELGNDEDEKAVMNVLNAGVKIITSTHGYGISDMDGKRSIKSLMENNVFSRYIVLSNKRGPGTLKEIYDGTGTRKIAGS